MAPESSTAPGLTVRNESGSTKTIIAGCRTDRETVFNETREVPDGGTARFSGLPDGPFEVGVRVSGGPQATERFRSLGDGDRIVASVSDSGIRFRTDEVDVAAAATGGGSAAREVGRDPEPAATDRRQDDDVYCRNCGELIKRHAETCPECGVANAAYEPAPGDSAANTGGAPASSNSTASQQSRGSEPTAVGRIGVLISAGIWALAGFILLSTFLLFEGAMSSPVGRGMGMMMQSLGVAAILPVVQILGWVLLPLSLYLDLNYVDYHVDDWPLHGRLYIAAAVILPALTQVFGAVALFVGGVSRLVGVLIPLLLLWLCLRHLRTRSRVLRRVDG